jgi:A/G-specific adenine glycosylase
MNPARVKIICKQILTWYRTHQRPFIWRTLRDPYAILLSEIMLQQTQADRVEEKLPLFLKKFPTFDALAGASKADILRAWQGLGYNNRAAAGRNEESDGIVSTTGRRNDARVMLAHK